MSLKLKGKEVNGMFQGCLIKHYVTLGSVDSDYLSYVHRYQANIGLSHLAIPITLSMYKWHFSHAIFTGKLLQGTW
jgi:hypothetical protein